MLNLFPRSPAIRRFRRLLAAGIAVLWTAAAPLHAQTGSYATSAGIETDDVVYRKVGGRELLLDVETPKPDGTLKPVVVFLCGNGMGYYNIDRGEFAYALDDAVQNGYVGVTVDYSSVKEHIAKRPVGKFPAQVHDVKSAIRFLRANAKEYAIDPDRIGVIAHSSGGNLALMLALTTPADGLEGEDSNMRYSSAVQAVVNLDGSTDEMANFWEGSFLYLGASPQSQPDLYRKASPIAYARPGAPPILSITGDQADTNIEQIIAFDKRMKEVGGSHTLIIKKGASHMDFDTRDKVVWEFLDKYLKK